MSPEQLVSAERSAQLQENLQRVKERIAHACRAAERDESEVTLIAVTKFFPYTDMAELYRLGQEDFGESRAQELSAKMGERGADLLDARIHFIGALQRNKAGIVSRYADYIHSVDRLPLAEKLHKVAEKQPPQKVLIQVSLDETSTHRSGASLGSVRELISQVSMLHNLKIVGLMAIAPLGVDPNPGFSRLAKLHQEVLSEHPEAQILSAGMSADLELAILHGATHLRIGSAILGNRPPIR